MIARRLAGVCWRLTPRPLRLTTTPSNVADRAPSVAASRASVRHGAGVGDRPSTTTSCPSAWNARDTTVPTGRLPPGRMIFVVVTRASDARRGGRSQVSTGIGAAGLRWGFAYHPRLRMADDSRRSPLLRWSWIALPIVALAAWVAMLSRDPRVLILGRSPMAARWVRMDRPFDVASRQNAGSAVSFAVTVDLPARTTLPFEDVRSIGRGTLSVDGRPLTADQTYGPGRHVVRMDVVNDNGPALALIAGRGVDLRTGVADWRASADGGRTWVRAVPADEPWEPSLAPQFGPPWRDVVRLSPLLVALTAVGTLALLRQPTGADRGRRVRWVVLLGWVVLAANNIMKVPLATGYDVDAHYQYIRYLAEHLRLPPADGGWQFFQAPLYYIVSAALERLGIGPHGLRIVPLLCGMAIAELSYRAARTVFPGRGDLHAVAVAVGGLLPVNLYMAQVVSNEPTAAAAAGVVVCATLALVADPTTVRSNRHLVGLGGAMGIAWLTKVSGLVWTLPVAAVVATLLAQQRAVAKDWARAAVVPAVALLVSGWYFAKNLVEVGRPFFRESSVQASQWWQDPGYRVPSNLYEFGHVFARPIYNGLGSVWDSLYGSLWGNGIPSGQPPWNFGLMGAGLWLGLIPTALACAGIAVAVVGRRNAAALRFAAASVALFVAAIVNVYLTLPIYSCAKASYALGTAPCVALLVAAGFDRLRPYRWPRAVVGGGIACWAVVAYLTYFVV